MAEKLALVQTPFLIPYGPHFDPDVKDFMLTWVMSRKRNSFGLDFGGSMSNLRDIIKDKQFK